MTTFLMLLLILSMYPIVKIIFYMPISALLKNHQHRKSLSLILTAVMTGILFIVLLVLAYTTMGYTLTGDLNLFNAGLEFYSFLGFTYVLGLFAAVVLLVLKHINKNTESKDSRRAYYAENILLFLIIGGFAVLILLIFYTGGV